MICFGCGQMADREVRLKEKRKNPKAGSEDVSGYLVLGALMGLFGLVFSLLSRPGRQGIIVTLPVCSRCVGKKPEVDHVDWENLRMRVVCHRHLREAAQ